MAILSYYRIYPTAGGNQYVWSTTAPTLSLTGGTITASSTVVVGYINICNTSTSIAFAQSPYTALPTCGSVICNTSGGSITVNLPDSATVPDEVFYFTNTGTNSVILTAFTGQAIDGSTTSTITGTGNRMLAIQCSGGNWTQALNETTPDPVITLNSTSIETDKTLTDPTNIIRCTQLATTGADVVITAGAPPTAGQALIATSATTAAFGNVFGLITAPQIIGNSTTPTCVKGAGAGSTGTTTLVGTDMAGVITVITGGTMTTGIICTVSFTTPYITAPYIMFCPANQAGGALSTTQHIFASSPASTSVFTLNTGSAALAAGVTYKWWYHVIG
jgi:hypothetical protein